MQNMSDNSATTPWLDFYVCRRFFTTGGIVAKVQLPLRGRIFYLINNMTQISKTPLQLSSPLYVLVPGGGDY